jgi:O-acetyl-ADP-ribose deacetylase (regulator of RNase III)
MSCLPSVSILNVNSLFLLQLKYNAYHSGFGLDVIQTVGPMGEVPDKLQQCYENCLKLAKSTGIRTIAFPCISTGTYRYPQKSAATVALSTTKKFLLENPDSVGG